MHTHHNLRMHPFKMTSPKSESSNTNNEGAPSQPPSSSMLLQSSSLSVAKTNKEKVRLPDDFKPHPHTVLCGRGKSITMSSGNRRLSSIVDSHLMAYSKAKNKVEKSSIVSSILSGVKEGYDHGAFVKLEDGVYWEIDESSAREKIGCILRDRLHSKYRSSNKSKLARKKQAALQAQQDPSYDSSSFRNVMMMSQSHIQHGGVRPHDTASRSSNPSIMLLTKRQETASSCASYIPNSQEPTSPQPSHAKQDVCSDPWSSPTKSSMQDYFALLSNYIGDQEESTGTTRRSCRSDFLRDCMPTPIINGSMPYSPRLVNTGDFPSGSNQKQENKVSALSALEHACTLITGHDIEDACEVEEDISAIFD